MQPTRTLALSLLLLAAAPPAATTPVPLLAHTYDDIGSGSPVGSHYAGFTYSSHAHVLCAAEGPFRYQPPPSSPPCVVGGGSDLGYIDIVPDPGLQVTGMQADIAAPGSSVVITGYDASDNVLGQTQCSTETFSPTRTRCIMSSSSPVARIELRGPWCVGCAEEYWTFDTAAFTVIASAPPILQPQPPSEPRMVTAIAGPEAGQVTVAWLPPENGTYGGGDAAYYIYRAVQPGGPQEYLGYTWGRLSTTFTDSTAEPGTTYCYVIYAQNSLNTSGPSEEACATA